MRITRKNWKQYIQNLAKADDKAAALITEFLSNHEIVSNDGFNAFADFFYAVVTKYAEGASEMAAQAYETIANAQGIAIKSAMPATTPDYGEVLKAIRGTMLTSDQPKALAQAAGRLVRRTGVDTTINNALRDGAEWAWVPSGDTCAFCMMLASEGWHKASKAALKNGHAKHIHANCDCTYAVRFDGKSTVEGYDPGYYKNLFDNAEGSSWKQKMNSIRRDKYAANKDRINAQKRLAYKARNSKESVAISRDNGIMNTRISRSGKVLNPMDKADYDKMVEGLRRNGIHVVEAKGDQLRFMLYSNAEASYSGGYITHVGEIPSRAALFEEIIHSTQAKKYGETTSDTAERAAREIAANRKLLKHAKAYRLDDMDIEDTKTNLAIWEKVFINVVGDTYDNSNIKREI